MISPKLAAYDYTLVVRTDFSDDRVWSDLRTELQMPQTEHNFAASVEIGGKGARVELIWNSPRHDLHPPAHCGLPLPHAPFHAAFLPGLVWCSTPKRAAST